MNRQEKTDENRHRPRRPLIAASATFAVAQTRTLELGFAGSWTTPTAPTCRRSELSAGVLQTRGRLPASVGGYYRIEIISDGTQEIAVEGPGFFRNVWVNEIVINDLEVRPLGVDSIEFDDEGTVEMSFIAITPGRYDLRIRGTTGETQRANFIVQ
jgi:hypothetical protein